MAEKKLRLSIVTPSAVKLDEDVDMVIMRCTTGDMGVLPDHTPYAAALGDGVVRIFSGEDERRIAVFGGIAEVKNNILTLITSVAEWPEDIDRERAAADVDAAQKHLIEGGDSVEIRSSQVQLRRSLVRVEVSSYPLVSKQKTVVDE